MSGERRKKASFCAALWCVCCGTRIFPVLCGHSTARTLWHLFLMSLVAGGVILAGIRGRFDAELAGCRRDFSAAFGRSVRISAQGIVPERRPPVPFFMSLPSKGGLFYTADGKGVGFPPGFCDRHLYFFVWSDTLLAAATRSRDGDWQIQLVDPVRNVRIVRADGKDVPALFAAELRRGASGWKYPVMVVSTEDIFKFAGIFTLTMIFLTEFLGCLLLALVCTGCFALFSRFTGAAALRGLTAGAYWRIGVYAGFPGMLIGGLCEWLRLPYLSYGIVYSAALVLYWLPASLACIDGGGGGDGAPEDA